MPGKALGRLTLAKPADPWVTAAILSSASRQSVPILRALVSSGVDPDLRARMIGPTLATLIGSKDARALDDAVASIVQPGPGGSFAPWQIASLAAVLDSGARVGGVGAAVKEAFEAARRLARDPAASVPDREAAIGLVGRDDGSRGADRAILVGLLDPQNPQEVQAAAVRALGRLGDPESTDGLLARWAGLGPALRAQALDSLLSRPGTAGALLGAVERGSISPAEIDASHRQELLAHRDSLVRSRSAHLLSSVKAGARLAVLEAARAASSRPGDSTRGEAVFARLCTGCHKFGGKGNELGPDLAALTDRSAEALRIAILDPNREVEARYAGFTAALKDGRVVTGLLASETGNAITLKRQEGQADVILRADLEELKTSGQSLMPEGLENDLKGSDLADLMAYVASGGERPKVLAGQPSGSS